MPPAQPGRAANPDQVPSDGSRRQSNRHGRRANGGNQRESRFEGGCDDLKGIVYDVTSGKETFLSTTRKVAEYVSRQYDDAGEFRTGMIDQVLPPLSMPADPLDPASMVQVEMWKIALRSYTKNVDAWGRNSHRIYALMLGQCSQALRNRLEAHSDWATVDGNTDVIGLLRLIQLCMSQRQTRKN